MPAPSHPVASLPRNLLSLACSRVSLATKVTGGAAGHTVAEEAPEERLDEGAEDDLGAAVQRSCQHSASHADWHDPVS